MVIENSALTEKGFVEKNIAIKNLSNGNYKIITKAVPNGKNKEQVIEMEFTQNGLNALVGIWETFTD